MAIAFVSSAAIENSTAASPTLACSTSGSDRIIVVATHEDSVDTISAVTYNGVPMTQIGSVLIVNGVRFQRLWYLVAPATGSNNIVVTRTGTNNVSMSAASYSGVKQTGVPDASTTAGGTSASPSSSLVSIADNCWHLMALSGNGSGGSNTNAGNWVVRGDAFTKGTIGDSNSAKTPAGSVTQSATLAASQSWGVKQITLAPAVAAGPTNLKTYNTNTAANIKSIDTNLIANVKSLNTNT